MYEMPARLLMGMYRLGSQGGALTDLSVLRWNPYNQALMFITMAAAIMLTIHRYGLDVGRIQQRLLGSSNSAEGAQTRAVIISRIGGGVLFFTGSIGSILVVGRDPWSYRILSGDPMWMVLGVVVPLLVVLPFLYAAAQQPSMQARYPEIRARWVPSSLALTSAAAWLVYLVGYEFMFRSLLLFTYRAAWGTWPAIFVTTALYVLAHFQKDGAETAGCFFMGFVFAAIVLVSNSIVPAILLHFAIAVVSENLSARANPNMHWWKTRPRRTSSDFRKIGTDTFDKVQ